jgi:peptidyl-dipeptidase Dcp
MAPPDWQIAAMTQNPLFAHFTGPFGLAPFSQITPAHFSAAFPQLMADALAEVEAIAQNPSPPTFANTIEALEKTGERLGAAAGVFYNLSGAHTNPDLQTIEREVAPAMARHGNAILLNEKLFARIDSLTPQGLTPEQARVLDLTKKDFIRAGAKLAPAARTRMKEISERLAVLTTQFSQNVLADESAFVLPLTTQDDRRGLPDWLLEAAASAASERGMQGHVITLSRSLIEPFLQFSSNRPLRELAFKAWTARGQNGNAQDNRALANEILHLRHERARALGFADFASFKLENQMAKNPANVRKLLTEVWQAAVVRAGKEEAKLQVLAAGEGENAPLMPWDWRYYAEKLRHQEHDLDTGLLKPYLQLDNIIAAAFHVAGKLFGLRFEEVHVLDLYHPDARAFEVKDEAGKHLALFIGDYFARPSKRSGAWMSGFRDQHKLKGEVRPIIVNVMNFAKAPEGKPCLLTMDDARTLFHEFGHALHGMMSDVTYPSISGTSVARDFVELPSQLYEHWFLAPEVLAQFATHAETRAPMPKELVDRVIGAANFNQGFASVEYTASALVDLALHEGEPRDALDVEAQVLHDIGMPKTITMRHRVPHFSHVFSGDGYSAGYYSYMWSEVMDADAFAAFEESGDLFNPEIAQRLAREIYAAGGRQDPAEAYIAFRGRLPEITPMLKKRGL